MKLISDYFSLSLVQFSLYLIPFFVTPYITRTISPYHYGTLELANNFITYLTIVVSFGFDVTGSRAIVIAKDTNERSKIFYAIIGAKALLFALTIVISLPLIFWVRPLHEIALPIFINMIALSASVIMPGWYFQAIQQLPFFARTNFYAKLVYAVIVLMTVKTSAQFLNIPLAASGTMAAIACYCLWKAYRSLDRIIVKPSLHEMLSLLKEGVPFFLSSIMISLYTVTCGFLLGMYTDPTHVAYYSAAAKIVTVLQSVIVMPISRILFPVIGNNIRNDLNKGTAQIRNIQFLLMALGIGIEIVLFFSAQIIVPLLFGADYLPSILILRILSVLPLAIGLSNLFGIQGLINMGYDRWLFWATVIGAIVGLTSNLVLIPLYKEIGAASGLIIAEVVMTILTYGFYRKAVQIQRMLRNQII